MFGSSGSPPKDTGPDAGGGAKESPKGTTATSASDAPLKSTEGTTTGEKRSGNGSPPGRAAAESGSGEKKRRSSGVGGKASSLLASAKNSLHFSPSPNSAAFRSAEQALSMQTPLQKLGKQDPALSVPQGQHNNSAGESNPGPRSTFRVGVWEDKNKKCRRTMEDTHAFLYNFLQTPAPALASISPTTKSQQAAESAADDPANLSPTAPLAEMMETDNGYFAIFDGHAGTFAADWCGKKLHIILEEIIRKNPNVPIPELLDQTFTTADTQLEKLPLKNSGCTAIAAVLRWEDRIPNAQSATGSTPIAPATAAAVKAAEEALKNEQKSGDSGIDLSKEPSQQSNPSAAAATATHQSTEATHAKLKTAATRQRVLYTANVGDARIVLCRNGKALRLSYDHKGSDENEGRRIANAGGMVINNRVNGVLAVTRALGDVYMKDLVTGHPYTTETVIQHDTDEFIILACDGLWDVCSDQEAVDLVRTQLDPNAAAKQLVDHALARFSTDNLSCMIVRFDKTALLNSTKDSSTAIGVEGDAPPAHQSRISEADKIVAHAKRKAADGVPSIGVSGSNSGKGHEPQYSGGGAEADVVPRADMEMEKVVEEEPDVEEEEDDDDDEDEDDQDGGENEDDRNGARLVPETETVDLSIPPGAAKPKPAT